MAASALGELRRYDEAARAALEAVRLEPDEAAWHHAAALALMEVPRGLEQALRAVDTAQRLVPDEPVLITTRGTVLLGLGRTGEAEQCFRSALSIRPDYAVAMHELARCRSSSGLVGPTKMARSAKGYADALGAAPDQQVSRTQLDLVIRQFFSQVCFAVGVLTYVAARLGNNDAHLAIRLVAALAVVAPLGVVGWFLHELPAHLRRYARTVVTTGTLRIATVLQAFTVVCLIGAVVVPDARQVPSVGVAFGASLAARIVVAVETRRFLSGRGHTLERLFSTGTLIFLCACAVFAGVFFALFLGTAPLVAAIGLITSAALAVWLGTLIRTRRRTSRTPR